METLGCLLGWQGEMLVVINSFSPSGENYVVDSEIVDAIMRLCFHMVIFV